MGITWVILRFFIGVTRVMGRVYHGFLAVIGVSQRHYRVYQWFSGLGEFQGPVLGLIHVCFRGFTGVLQGTFQVALGVFL